MNLTDALRAVRGYDNFWNLMDTVRTTSPRAAVVVTDTHDAEWHEANEAEAWGVIRREVTELARREGCTCAPHIELGPEHLHHIIVRHNNGCPAERVGRRHSLTSN